MKGKRKDLLGKLHRWLCAVCGVQWQVSRRSTKLFEGGCRWCFLGLGCCPGFKGRKKWTTTKHRNSSQRQVKTDHPIGTELQSGLNISLSSVLRRGLSAPSASLNFHGFIWQQQAVHSAKGQLVTSLRPLQRLCNGRPLTARGPIRALLSSWVPTNVAPISQLPRLLAFGISTTIDLHTAREQHTIWTVLIR